MPSATVVDQFVATVVSRDYVGAIERFYTQGASMQENQSAPRVGRQELVRNEQGVMAMFPKITCEIAAPPLISGDQVSIQWRFVFTPAGGQSRSLHEVAWQRWEGDRIAEEKFFYDPEQITGEASRR